MARWSWNDAEDEALQGLRPHTQVMYLRGMRRFMDYATGYVGYQRRISYQALAETAHTVPDVGARDRPAPLTKKAARCAVDELERAGLVERVPADRSLILRLPLADTDSSVQKRRGTGGAQEGHRGEGHAQTMEERGLNGKDGHAEGHTLNTEEGHPSGIRYPGTDISPDGDTSAGGPPPCPQQDILALYREICVPAGMPDVRVWNDQRKGLLRARWREADKHQSLEFWRRYFNHCANSLFLTGQSDPKPGQPPFVADLEWVVRPNNFAKIVEGRYHRGN